MSFVKTYNEIVREFADPQQVVKDLKEIVEKLESMGIQVKDKAIRFDENGVLHTFTKIQIVSEKYFYLTQILMPTKKNIVYLDDDDIALRNYPENVYALLAFKRLGFKIWKWKYNEDGHPGRCAYASINENWAVEFR